MKAGLLLLGVILVGLVVGGEGKYHQAPDPKSIPRSEFYRRARFPNHPFFPANKKVTSHPLIDAANCQQFWFPNQIVDHFSNQIPPLNITTFQERYFVCDGFWDKNSSSPIFFYLGNESDVELYVNNTGLMYELAPRFNALLVFAEHRYFGLTQPFGAETPKYMNYLTMEQAMADYAHFLAWFTQTNNLTNPPIIGFGGSYGGMLSAWFRMKYPGSIDGAISGSAPIMAFLGIEPAYNVDAFQIIETEDATPAQGSSINCAPNVRETFKNIFKYGATESGRKQLTADFMLCSPLGLADVSTLAEWVKSAFDFLSMGDYPYPSSYMTDGIGILPGYPYQAACNILNVTTTDPPTLFQAMREAISIFYNVSGSFSCYDIHQAENNQTDYEILYWSYLECSEIFVPHGQNGKTDMFWDQPFSLTGEIATCKQTWPEVDPKVYWISETYGGYSGLHASSNIFFSNGVLDPWHGGGILQNASSTLIASLMEGAAHHLDLFFSNPLDPASVTQTRQMESDTIQAWIDQKLNI